ncbi:hypothetical protein J1N35_040509 [Gossypium stocksii]|uniref:Uncharacterized protein n=1 Tax=Gossypium stocksii TaxID=47602 RepID=A0A9D3UDQ2_9ROSI|nr:hypothetical protein J1N35_040509 [Gossypium stocksii]
MAGTRSKGARKWQPQHLDSSLCNGSRKDCDDNSSNPFKTWFYEGFIYSFDSAKKKHKEGAANRPSPDGSSTCR